MATLLVIAAAITVLSARDIAMRMDQEKITTAEETMALIATLAADMGGQKPHEFVSQMVTSGQFQRIGVYCTKQKVNVEGTPNGLVKTKGAPTIAASAIDRGAQVVTKNPDSITVARPLFKPDGRLSGAVYITVDRTEFRQVFNSLMSDLAPIVATVAAAGIAIALLLAKKLSAPISHLTSAASRIARGALETKIKSRGPLEFRRLSASVSTMVDHLRSSLREINRLAFVDTVTRLPNRADFLKRGSEAVHEHRRLPGSQIGVLFVDLDGFKAINDTHGHDIGDKVLRHFALELSKTLRETDGMLNSRSDRFDTASLPARLGGDEFTVLLTGLHEPTGADCVAKRILQIVEKPFEIDGITLTMGASIGVAVSEAQGAEFERLLSEADAAMYDVKRAGKNNFKRVNL
ncbi:MAG: diguanylate cyclase [Pseudomonadota bacterium]